MTPLTLSSGPWTIPSNSDRLWTIPSNNDWFEIGEFRTTGLIIIDFSTASKLLAGNPVAFKTFFEKLATEMAKKVGNNHPLVIGLETLVGTQFQLPIPPEDPVGETRQLPPHTKAGGSNGPWPDCDDR